MPPTISVRVVPDAWVKVVVAQCPVFVADSRDVDPAPEVFAAIRESFEYGDVSGGPEDKTGPIPIVSSDQLGTPSLLQPIQAFHWFVDYGGRHGSGWQDRATSVIPSHTAPYSPYLCAPFATVPSLMMVAPVDEMVHANPEVSRQAFDLLPAEKDWYDIGGGHFGLLYYPATSSTKQARSRLTSSQDTFSPDPLAGPCWSRLSSDAASTCCLVSFFPVLPNRS